MQNLNVNITPDNYPQSLYYSQNDVGREFKINITDFTIPVGATVKIQATKPSGFGFSVAGTVSGNSVTFETTDEMTDEAGRFPAELVIESGAVVIGTANFLMVGEQNPHPPGTTDGSQGTIIPELTLLVERVEAAASSVLDMQVVAQTLPAGSQASYSYDEDLNKATFGIPEGQAGAGAAGVVASAYSAAKTYKVGDYVLYNSNLYRCTTAITTAEAWTAAHWTQIVLADDVTDLKTDLSETNTNIGLPISPDVVWRDGYYVSKTDGAEVAYASYHSSPYIEIPQELYELSIKCVDPNSYDTGYNAWYDANKNFISSFSYGLNTTKVLEPPKNAKYFKLSSNSTVKLTVLFKYESVTELVEYGSDMYGLPLRILSNTSYYFGQGYFQYWDARVGTHIPIKAKGKLKIKALNGYLIAVFKFTDETLATEVSSSGWVSEILINEGDVFLFNVRNAGYTQITPKDAYANLLFTLIDSVNSNNYVIGADLLKRNVFIQNLGVLTYLQAFCRYDGKYYSINGTNISEQNASFTELRNVALNTGHGNALQLGNSKYAYASGWDDQKVYKVDLENLTIADTITLPTTGYTTCAVDELRGLIYIFQRDSYPDTEANYNFIVYDYVNEEIKSTKQILAFSAMQSVDLFDDKLFVLNGLGGSTTPNGYRVFDLNGNILAEYFFGDFSSIEPEGVCIDRGTHDLYISFVDKKVYKVTA